eukprot:g9455.t1
MAIIGMFFQDGLTGSAWGDWALYTDSPLRAFEEELGNGWAQIVAFAGYYELFVYKYSGTPGDYGWKAISSADAETKKRKLSAELANGRLAMTLGMMAIIGMFFQDGLTGSAWGDWANYTDSPLRAFENETGVQPPVGFWDPLGLSVSGNQSDYKRRREVELKHGRVAMFATIGYILPEYWRFPGYLSKFLDIKFADVPNGLAAFSKVPALGWLQIVGFAGIVELNVYNEEVNGEPGNYGSGFLGLRSVGVMNSGISDPELRQEELGVQAPVGFWDPVGYTRYLSPSLGLKFEDVPNGLAAIAKVPGNGWAQIVAFAGYYELFVYKYSGTPGDYGWKAISSADAETKKRKLSAELANGRLAMTLGDKPRFAMAIIGMFFQDGLTGSAWGDWANYTDSPLRAFENETGVQPPVGFWDPLGLSVSGNQSDYKRRREVELKHGRVAMFATIGYILPEYWRFPGYLSKFLDIKFADVPNGLAAFSKVPALGWLQIVGFAGIVELNVYNEEVNGEPGNYGSGFLGLRQPGSR